MTQYRIDFTRIGQDTDVAPFVTEAGDLTELALNIGEYVNGSRTAQRNREVIGGDVHDDMSGGYLLSEAGEDYGTFTVTPAAKTYDDHKAEALDNGFPELLAHKVAGIRARQEQVTGARTFTVIYTGMGEPIVHAAGCTHNVRDSLAGAHTTEDVTGTLEDVGAHVYADMLDEGSMSPEDCVPNLNVKPCAR